MSYVRIYIIQETIDYLNSVTGRSYSHEDVNTIDAIFNLMKMGYTIDDLKAVIDKKWAQWKGTKYEIYVRPSTLFGKNFENYLNEPAITKKSTIGKLLDAVGKAKQHSWRMGKNRG